MRKLNSTNSLNESRLLAACPMQTALRCVGGRWKMVIIWYVSLGIDRFGRLRARLPGISSRMLTRQLQELRADRLLEREAHLRQIRYHLTAEGKEIMPALRRLNAWGESRLGLRPSRRCTDLGHAA